MDHPHRINNNGAESLLSQLDDENRTLLQEIEGYEVLSTNKFLRKKLDKLEEDSRFRFNNDVFLRSSYNEANFPRFPEHHDEGFDRIEEIKQMHARRLAVLKEMLRSPYEENVLGHGVALEDGGIKTLERSLIKLQSRVERGKEADFLPDLSRARLICEDLSRAESVAVLLRKKFPFCLAIFNNFYQESARSARKQDTLYRSFTTVWTSRNHNSFGDCTDDYGTEIQILTRRMRAVMDLNHGLDISRTADYQSPEEKQHIERLFLGAALLDAEEYLESLKKEM